VPIAGVGIFVLLAGVGESVVMIGVGASVTTTDVGTGVTAGVTVGNLVGAPPGGVGRVVG
jgi:hypothetical protein